MSKYNYNLKNKAVLDNIRSPLIYEFNLAQNLALLSNDPAVIRNFYQVEASKLTRDQWLINNINNRFMAYYQRGQAFSYFGLIPMIVQAKVNLIASNGFKCESEDKEIDTKLNEVIEKAQLDIKFAEGVYLESGLGDFAFRVSCNTNISDRPIINLIEPQNLEINYEQGIIKSFVVKQANDEDPDYELREVYYKNSDGYVVVTYLFYYDGEIVPANDTARIEQCKGYFVGIDTSERTLPLREYPIIFKKNSNSNQLYRGERGVPDIQGLDTIEDALTESISDLIDAIRKGGIKEYIDKNLIPTDIDGNQFEINHFNKTIITTKGASTPGQGKDLWQVTQGDIRWEAYIKTIQTLMSTGINKAGLSPTTLGLTGLESINSSAESQEARERTSLRTRELCLKSWAFTLKELLNRYLQVIDYMEGREIYDYSQLIKIQFDDYVSPSIENVTDTLLKQVQSGLKSPVRAIMDLNSDFSEEDAEKEFFDILMAKSNPTPVNMENIPPKNDNLGDSDPNTTNLENSAPQRLNNLEKEKENV